MDRLVVGVVGVFCCLSLLSFISYADQGSIGVNLPSELNVIELLKSQGLDRVKIHDTDSKVLKALAGSNIKVIVGLPNKHLNRVAKYQSSANSWVEKNIAQYYPSTQIYAIAVGNDVFGDPKKTSNFLIPAMKNLQAALVYYKLDSAIKISSPLAFKSSLQTSNPSSSGSFKSNLIEPVIKPMLEFLHETKSFLMVNIYPFFTYESKSDVVSLDYALFRENTGFVDSGNGLRYWNVFDAQIDAFYAAMNALNYQDLKIVVTEIGWPSKGDENEIWATEENAAEFNVNLVRRVLTGGGTPLKPANKVEVYQTTGGGRYNGSATYVVPQYP